MPDMKTALSKVINEWEKPAAAPAAAPAPAPQKDATKPWRFQPTNNITRATFDHIKNNPGLSRVTITQQMTEKGYKATSASTLISQMLRQGLLKTVNGGVFVTQPEYTPLRTSALVAARKAKAAKAAKTAKAETREAPEPLATRKAKLMEAAAPIVKQGRSVKDIIDTLSVLQARELYDELRKIFGFRD